MQPLAEVDDVKIAQQENGADADEHDRGHEPFGRAQFGLPPVRIPVKFVLHDSRLSSRSLEIPRKSVNAASFTGGSPVGAGALSTCPQARKALHLVLPCDLGEAGTHSFQGGRELFPVLLVVAFAGEFREFGEDRTALSCPAPAASFDHPRWPSLSRPYRGGAARSRLTPASHSRRSARSPRLYSGSLLLVWQARSPGRFRPDAGANCATVKYFSPNSWKSRMFLSASERLIFKYFGQKVSQFRADRPCTFQSRA